MNVHIVVYSFLGAAVMATAADDSSEPAVFTDAEAAHVRAAVLRTREEHNNPDKARQFAVLEVVVQ
jgi:hypothetical protein